MIETFKSIFHYISKNKALLIILTIFIIISCSLIKEMALNIAIIVFILVLTILQIILYKTIKNNNQNITNFIIMLIIVYLSVIIIFGFIFYIFTNSQNYLHYTNNEKLKYLSEYIYFSAITFFAVGYGDILPVGIFRLITIIEILLMNIMNIVFIGSLSHFIINNKLNNELKKVSDIEKKLEKDILKK